MTMEDGDNEQRTHSIGQHPQQRTTEPLRKSAQSKQQRISGKQGQPLESMQSEQQRI